MERISNMLEINHEHNKAYQTRRLANKIFLLKHYIKGKYADERSGNRNIRPTLCIKTNITSSV